MPPTPESAERKARAIRELSRELSHSPRSFASPTPPDPGSNPTLREGEFGEDSFFFDPEHEAIMSTRQLDDDTTNPLPRATNLRSTAKKEFQDFDHSTSDDESASMSIEQARGPSRNARDSPARLNSSFVMHDSLYDMTPPAARTRKSNVAETGSLRRDAQIRRASTVPQKDTGSARNSPAGLPKQRNSLANMHAKVSQDESFLDERPPTITLQSKPSRFNGRRSRQTSLQLDGTIETPPRANHTPKSAPMTANATAQSFMLPDLPNLTELVSGVFQDGTPIFSRTAPSRSRFQSHNGPSRGGPARSSKHTPIDSVPIPSEEKAIFASLQLLKEKVAQLEQQRAESEKKMEEQELELIELRAANEAQDKLRRSDSALGSTDGEGSGGKTSWKVEKTRLEASVQTLRTRLDRAERKLSVAEINGKRVTTERDNLVTQLSVAFYSSEELKNEKEALQTENETLRQEIDMLRAENERLQHRLAQEQEQFQEETRQLRHKGEHTETLAKKENETLRAELARVRGQHDEDTQRWQIKDTELRKAKKQQAEYAKLKDEHDSLRAQIASLKAKREEEARRWAGREAELENQVNRRDETIRHFQDMTLEETNEAIRVDNDNLKAEMARVNAQYDEDNERWAKKEAQLRRRIQKREAQNENLTRQVLVERQANGQQMPQMPQTHPDPEDTFRAKTNAAVQRRPSQRLENTNMRIAKQVQREVHNSRSVSAAQPSESFYHSPRKTSTRLQSSRASLPPTMPSRTFSAPVTAQKHAQVESDVESTTDLSLAQRGTPYVMRGAASGMPTAPVEPPAALDMTELSFIQPERIEQLRRQLEEERAGLRKKAASAPPAERATREDTVRSNVSTKNRQPSLSRKSSMKDVTERTNRTVFEDLTGNVTQQTQKSAAPEQTQTKQTVDSSVLSQSSRRRRSAPVEMTSAFILPDITIHTRKSAIKLPENIQLPTHDNDNCTICRRTGASTSTDPVKTPKLVPASERMPDESDATIRPVRSPREALSLVVKELEDELAHLKLEFRTHEALLLAHDASLGRRKRKAIEDAMEDLLKLMSIKADQVYNLYDVLEGQHADDLTQAQVEEITQSVLHADEVPEVVKKPVKKVVVQSFHEDESEGDGDGEESAREEHTQGLTGELSWRGFDDSGLEQGTRDLLSGVY